MLNTRLIMFEGIPGSGKTTTSKLLHKIFIEKGITSSIYIEGCDHPIDLPFYAYLSISEYDALLMRYKKQSQWLQKNSIIEESYVLSPYKIPEPYPSNVELINYLASKELCYSSKPTVTFDTFKKVFYKRFERYVDKIMYENQITIFESVLLQHQIHDINRLYKEVKHSEIIEYLKNLGDILKPLKPMLFYISQDSVENSLKNTAIIRSKPKWGTEETILYYEKRKALELKVINELSLECIILNNTDYNWDKVFNCILKKLLLTK